MITLICAFCGEELNYERGDSGKEYETFLVDPCRNKSCPSHKQRENKKEKKS